MTKGYEIENTLLVDLRRNVACGIVAFPDALCTVRWLVLLGAARRALQEGGGSQ